MKIAVYILTIAVLLIGGCNSSHESSSRTGYDFSSVEKVAIVAVEGAVKSEAARDQIADFFAMELLKKGYAPMGRAQVRTLLGEQEVESEDLIVTEGTIEVGQVLNVPAVLTIKIPHFGEQISITSQMIDVEDGSILWLASGSGKSGRSLSDFFGFNKDSGGLGSEDGALLGGVMGGMGGQALSPQEAKKTQRIVKKMCRSLPSKIAPEW
ncbi:MAG: hypothetical protein ACYTFW_04215 [Planctomycetota bacterium]|jgi:hypothetical protein